MDGGGLNTIEFKLSSVRNLASTFHLIQTRNALMIPKLHAVSFGQHTLPLGPAYLLGEDGGSSQWAKSTKTCGKSNLENTACMYAYIYIVYVQIQTHTCNLHKYSQKTVRKLKRAWFS